jgi:hypothetical protein
VGLVVSVAVSVWVGLSFQANRFEYVWPIVFLRWFAIVFYQILDVSRGCAASMCGLAAQPDY